MRCKLWKILLGVVCMALSVGEAIAATTWVMWAGIKSGANPYVKPWIGCEIHWLYVLRWTLLNTSKTLGGHAMIT
jgi:hypothetical protein